MGITLLPPDVNRSKKKFDVEDGAVRFGLLAIKSLGAGVIDEIVKERQKGPYTSFRNFLERVMAAGSLQKKAVENLIWAGAFDTLHGNRAELIGIFEQEMDAISHLNKNNLVGQYSFFDVVPDAAEFPRPEFARRLRLQRKKSTGTVFIGSSAERSSGAYK